MPEDRAAHRVDEGIFRRGSDVYRGGPVEGPLQRLHPAGRMAGAVILLLGVSLCRNPAALVLIFAVAIVAAVLSYLNLKSLYKIMLVPVVLMALPVWVVASLLHSSVEAGSLFFLRTLTSLAVAGVAIHSVGLRNIAEVMDFLRFPAEFKQMWSIMVAQVVSFAGLVSDMMLARKARHVGKVRGGQVRVEVGRQAGVLFARTWQRGNELAYAMDARNINGHVVRGIERRAFAGADYAFLLVCMLLLVGLAVV